MTAPPREPTPEPCVNCGKARSDHYIVNFADGPQISGMTWICPGSVYDAAPAPSAYTTGHCKENAKKGGCQLHNLHCGWPECDRRPAPAPTAAQPAEPVLPCAIDGCKQPSLMPASEYCSLHSAIGTSPTGGEFATQPAEPPAQAATDDLPKLGLTRWGRKADGNVYEMPDGYWTPWHIADELLQRQAREIADYKQKWIECAAERTALSAQLADGYHAAGLSHHVGILVNRVERAEAERDAMRECVRELVACADESDSLAAERLYGKPHTPEYKTRELDHRQRSIEAWKAARAKVKGTT